MLWAQQGLSGVCLYSILSRVIQGHWPHHLCRAITHKYAHAQTYNSSPAHSPYFRELIKYDKRSQGRHRVKISTQIWYTADIQVHYGRQKLAQAVEMMKVSNWEELRDDWNLKNHCIYFDDDRRMATYFRLCKCFLFCFVLERTLFFFFSKWSHEVRNLTSQSCDGHWLLFFISTNERIACKDLQHVLASTESLNISNNHLPEGQPGPEMFSYTSIILLLDF